MTIVTYWYYEGKLETPAGVPMTRVKDDDGWYRAVPRPWWYALGLAAWSVMLLVLCLTLWAGNGLHGSDAGWLPDSEDGAYSDTAFEPVRNRHAGGDGAGPVLNVQGHAPDGTTARINVSTGTVYFSRFGSADRVEPYVLGRAWLRYARWIGDGNGGYALDVHGSDDCGGSMCEVLSGSPEVLPAPWGRDRG